MQVRSCRIAIRVSSAYRAAGGREREFVRPAGERPLQSCLCRIVKDAQSACTAARLASYTGEAVRSEQTQPLGHGSTPTAGDLTARPSPSASPAQPLLAPLELRSPQHGGCIGSAWDVAQVAGPEEDSGFDQSTDRPPAHNYRRSSRSSDLVRRRRHRDCAPRRARLMPIFTLQGIYDT